MNLAMPIWFPIAAGGATAIASLVLAFALAAAAPNNPRMASAAVLLGCADQCRLSRFGHRKSWLRAGSWITSPRLDFPLAPLGLAIGIAVELFAAPTLLLVYRTRLVAAVLVAYCVATAMFFHRHVADLDQQMNFLKNFAIAGGLLQIIAYGAGSFSLNAIWRKPLLNPERMYP